MRRGLRVAETHKNLALDMDELIGSYNTLGSKINSFIQYVEKEWR